jgi:hypothetical protein
MNFKFFFKDKYNYNAILVIINKFEKDCIFIFCYKIINAYKLAKLFIN